MSMAQGISQFGSQPVADPSAVLEVFRALVRDVFERDSVRVDAATRLNDDLDMDSLDVLALLAEASRRMAVEIEVTELAELASVGQCVDLALDAMARAHRGHTR
jgi:acyl carrier protein